MAGIGQRQAVRGGAVGRIAEHLQAAVLAGEQPKADHGLMVIGAAGLAQRAVGDDPGVGLDGTRPFEPSLPGWTVFWTGRAYGANGEVPPIPAPLRANPPRPLVPT